MKQIMYLFISKIKRDNKYYPTAFSNKDVRGTPPTTNVKNCGATSSIKDELDQLLKGKLG